MGAVASTEEAFQLHDVEAQPHARAVLAPALRAGASASHAYLFHGPAGSGKRAAARAFAAALLARDASELERVRERVQRGAHPDLTWVTRSGASEMLVSDIDEPVVAAATRTPFEAPRRVFVIEDADAMNDQAANRLLKTLEEPPDFVHVLLLTERREDVLATIVSRCQPVRFDPLAAPEIAARLDGVEGERALACARLSLGDATLAAQLAGKDGATLRASAERFARAALAGELGERPWAALLAAAKAAGERAGERSQEGIAERLELAPAKERRRIEREGVEARRRVERRARTHALDVSLRLVELWLRDVLCVREGAAELVHAVDRAAELQADADAVQADATALREAVELVADTRVRLRLNVSEELALEALAYRLADRVRR